MAKQKTELSKAVSTLMKDINRIRKIAYSQAKMNILRKHQLNLLDQFLKKLIKEKRMTIEELRPYNIKKKEAENILFKDKRK